MGFARSLWLRVETIHAVTYFDPVCCRGDGGRRSHGVLDGLLRVPGGADGRRRGRRRGGDVLQLRAHLRAPLGARTCGTATSPETLVAVRCEAAADRRCGRSCPTWRPPADAVNGELARAVAAVLTRRAPAVRRRTASVPLADDPVRALWQLCTCLREHRGDGHVAALTAAGFDGCEAHVLIALDQGNSPEDLQKTRGWTDATGRRRCGAASTRGTSTAAEASPPRAGRCAPTSRPRPTGWRRRRSRTPARTSRTSCWPRSNRWPSPSLVRA